MPKQTVLAIFANPAGTDPLRLGEEDRVIRECMRLSERRDIKLHVRHASTVHDARRALLLLPCTVVHFAGHGSSEGLILEDEAGKPRVIPPEALAELLAAYAPPLHTVLLNACYSGIHSALLSALHVPYVIAIKQRLSDRSAIEFVRGFYDALAADRDSLFAYQEGCRTLHLLGHGAHDTPTLTQSNASRARTKSADDPSETKKARANTESWAIRCQLCRGTGWLGLFNRIACTTCAGSGKLTLSGNAADYVRCRSCRGIGTSGFLDFFDRVACTSCRGSGVQHL